MGSVKIPVAHRVAGLRPTAVNTILAEVRATPGPVASLMRGEPDLRTPAHIVEAATKSLAAGRTTYPDQRGEPRLREAVAEKLERDNGVRYDPATEILVTTGATFGIYVAITAMLNEGDAVMLPDPVYDAYLSPLRLAGAVPVPVPAEIVDGRFVLTEAALEAAWRPECKALLLNTPWNPVGTVFTGVELARIGAFCEPRNLALISDEIYEAIVYEGHQHISPAALSPELRERTVLVNALSKTYAMTGWRVGYCAAPAAFVRAMTLVLQQSSRGPAMFVQDAAAAALSGPQECVKEMRSEYSKRRTQVLLALADIPGCTVMAPEGGFFAMVDIRGLGVPSDVVRRRLLTEFGVVVIHGAAYGPSGEGTLRVSFASGGETLATGLKRLRTGLESYAKG